MPPPIEPRRAPFFGAITVVLVLLSSLGPIGWWFYIDRRYGPLPGEAAVLLMLTPIGLAFSTGPLIAAVHRREKWLWIPVIAFVAPSTLVCLWFAFGMLLTMRTMLSL